ncbi:MAG: hypothetical protein ACOH5I_11120 [Oligoflexus sp.]
MIHFNKIFAHCTLLFFAWLMPACAYRFTNVALAPPPNVRTIAIEAVYNTSREVIPHEWFWQAVQAEFARNGRVWLTSPEQADALMTLHITQASVAPSGTPIPEAINRDPPVSDRGSLSPFNFKNLRIAGSYTTTETINFQVEVTVHHLRQRRIIHRRLYQSGGSFRSFQASTVSQINSGFLMYQEGMESRFRQLSEQLSRRIVTDFFLAT